MSVFCNVVGCPYNIDKLCGNQNVIIMQSGICQMLTDRNGNYAFGQIIFDPEDFKIIQQQIKERIHLEVVENVQEVEKTEENNRGDAKGTVNDESGNPQIVEREQGFENDNDEINKGATESTQNDEEIS